MGGKTDLWRWKTDPNSEFSRRFTEIEISFDDNSF